MKKEKNNQFNEKTSLLNNSNNNNSNIVVTNISTNYSNESENEHNFKLPILIQSKSKFSNLLSLYQLESFKKVRRWLALLVGCLVMTASGTQYSFSSISPSLKKTFMLSQSQVNLIGTTANLGSNFSFIFSFANDIFGSRVCALLSGACLFISYFGMSLIVTGNLPFIDPYISFCFLMFLMGSACGGGFTSALSTSMKNFPEKNRGLVIGVLSSCYGISSAIYSGAYLYIFEQELEIYLIFCAILGGVVIMIMGPLFLDSKANSLSINNNSKNNENSINGNLENDENSNDNENILSINNNDEEEDSNQNLNHENSTIENDDGIENYDNLNEKIENLQFQISSNTIPDINPFRMLLSLDFYLSFLITFLFAGSGLVVINNLGSIVQSYGGRNGEQNNMVIVFSLCNCTGRIAFGLLSDKLFNPQRQLTRITFIGVAVLMMLIGQYVFALLPNTAGFYPLVIWIGLCYGGFYALNPSFISERFGSKYYGLNSTLQALSGSLGSYSFSTGLAGYLYQQGIVAPRTLSCHGTQCYEWTFYILACGQCLAFVLVLILHWRTMWLYKLLYKRRNWTNELSQLMKMKKKKQPMPHLEKEGVEVEVDKQQDV